MIRSSLRGAVATTGAVAVAAGLALSGSPASAVVNTVNFTNFCIAAAPIVGNIDKPTDYAITVDAPATVQAGQTFTYRIQNAGSAFPNSEQGASTTTMQRLKADYAIPANATFVSAAVVPGTGFNNTGVAPNVLRVNESGAVDNAAGTIVRLSGNNQVIGNSPTSSTSADGGIAAAKTKLNLDGTPNSAGDSWFRLPAVDITVVAGAAGTTIQPKVRTAGAASTNGNDANWYTLLGKASLGNAVTRCVPKNAKADTNLNAGGGALATINVVAAEVATTTAVSAPATATTGQSVTLSATVAPSATGGTVQFKDGNADIGASVPVTAGGATLTHTFTASGAHSITAVYSGGTGFLGSTSAASVVDVTDPAPADVATTTALAAPTTAVEGQSVTLSATVAPSGAGGTVQFFDSMTALGASVPVTAGGATLTHTFTAPGAHAVTAVYSGAPGFLGSSSDARVIDVTAAPPVDGATTTAVSAPTTATKGQSVTLSATVAPSGAGGTVQFKDGNADIGASVPVTAGGATLTHTFTASGAHSITAVYSGGTGFLGSTSDASVINVTEPETPPTGGNNPFGSS